MARVVPGVKPRVKDANAFNAVGVRRVMNPMFAAIRARLAGVDSLSSAVVQLSFLRGLAPDVEFVPDSLDDIDLYHYTRFSQTFQTALKVDVRPLLTRPAVAAQLDRSVRDSVSLIRTIPPRLHDDLTERLRQEFRTSPFNRGVLRQVLRDEFGSSGFNLRRLTRDQSNKLVGNLTRIRQGQVGVTRYRWLTSGDERVREEHVTNNGKIFEWSSPPPVTGHPGNDIMCRCVALAVVDTVPDVGV